MVRRGSAIAGWTTVISNFVSGSYYPSCTYDAACLFPYQRTRTSHRRRASSACSFPSKSTHPYACISPIHFTIEGTVSVIAESRYPAFTHSKMPLTVYSGRRTTLSLHDTSASPKTETLACSTSICRTRPQVQDLYRSHRASRQSTTRVCIAPV